MIFPFSLRFMNPIMDLQYNQSRKQIKDKKFMFGIVFYILFSFTNLLATFITGFTMNNFLPQTFFVLLGCLIVSIINLIILKFRQGNHSYTQVGFLASSLLISMIPFLMDEYIPIFPQENHFTLQQMTIGNYAIILIVIILFFQNWYAKSLFILGASLVIIFHLNTLNNLTIYMIFILLLNVLVITFVLYQLEKDEKLKVFDKVVNYSLFQQLMMKFEIEGQLIIKQKKNINDDNEVYLLNKQFVEIFIIDDNKILELDAIMNHIEKRQNLKIIQVFTLLKSKLNYQHGDLIKIEEFILQQLELSNNQVKGIQKFQINNKYIVINIESLKIYGEDYIVINSSDLTNYISVERKANNFKNEVFSSINHNLKTPLNGIIPLIYDSIESTDIDEIKTNLHQIGSNSKMLQYMIQDIIDCASIRNNILRDRPSQTSIAEIILEINSIFLSQFAIKQIQFSIKTTIQKSQLITDKSKLIQVLINLLTNALKFTYQGNVELRIEDYQFQGKNLIKFTVSDTGIGITQEILTQIKSQRLILGQNQELNRQSGMGLGNYICSHLLDIIGPFNKVFIKTIVNQGSKLTFFVYKELNQVRNCPIDNSPNISSELHQLSIISLSIPEEITNEKQKIKIMNMNKSLEQVNELKNDNWIQKQKNNQEDESSIEDGLTENQVQSNFIKCFPLNSSFQILIVDDTIFNIEVIKTIFKQQQQFNLSWVFNGQQAIDEILKEENQIKKFGFIFMDINMPVMDGFQTTEILKNNMKNGLIQNSFIICISAYEGIEERNQMIKNGADRFLNKPFDSNELFKFMTDLKNTQYNYQ